MQLTVRNPEDKNNILKGLAQKKKTPQSNNNVAKCCKKKNQAFMLQLIGADVGQVS